jgi:hypothetical protein
MSSIKISALPAVASLNGNELIPVVKDGGTQRATISQLTTASLDNFIAAGTGAVFRSAQDKMRDIISVKDFGAVGTGSADDRAAIATAFVAATEVYFPPGTYLVGSNLTVAANKVVRMAAGAAFSVAAGVTLTINAHFEGDPDSYHFQGAGSVVGVVDVYPEWFGAVGNGTTNDQPAFQRASACVKSDGSVAAKCTIRLQAKNYLLSSSWTVEPTANRPIDVIGMGTLIGGSRLLSSASNTGPVMIVQGNTNAIQNIVDFTLSGFAIISQNIGQGQGLYFNYTGNAQLNGLQMSLVENIHINNFKQGIVVRNTRLVKFSRTSVWNNGIDGTTLANANWCMIITDGTVGEFDFCGDLTFDNCQFIARKDFYSKLVQVNAQSANSATVPSGKTIINVAGIRFNECIFYRGGNSSVEFFATNYSQMADVWLTNCQFDDTTGLKVAIGSANALMTDVNIQGNYYTAAAGNCVLLDGAAASGRINSINIANNYCAGVFGTAATNAVGVHGINVNGNRWSGVEWSIGSVMRFENCSQVNCCDNNMGRAGPNLVGNFSNVVRLTGTGNYYVVTGNNSAGLATSTLVNNTTGAANTAIANNI